MAASCQPSPLLSCLRSPLPTAGGDVKGCGCRNNQSSSSLKWLNAEFPCESESVSRSVLSDCDPMHHSPPGSSVHGILQARILEWVAIPFSRGSSRPRDRPLVHCTAGRLYPLSHQGFQTRVSTGPSNSAPGSVPRRNENKSMQKPEQGCSQKQCSQLPKGRNNPNVHPWMIG